MTSEQITAIYEEVLRIVSEHNSVPEIVNTIPNTPFHFIYNARTKSGDIIFGNDQVISFSLAQDFVEFYKVFNSCLQEVLKNNT